MILLLLAASPAGLTLVPDDVRSGEALRFVVAGAVRTAPSAEADTLSMAVFDDRVEAVRRVVHDDVGWIETGTGGWIEACRLDRLPEPVSGDLPAGREGLTDGRVLPWDYEPTDLVAVPDTLKAEGFRWRSMRVRRDALAAFEAMIAAAREAGVEIGILSAHRSADYQRGLYRRAVDRDPGQRSSAPPGRSEHQLGTAVDVTSPGTPVLSAALAESDAGRWLHEHSEEFGVVISYSRTRHVARGAVFEPWHLRWVGAETASEERW